MPARERKPWGPWICVMESGELWFCEGPGGGPEAQTLNLFRVERDELRDAYPGLHRALVASDHMDCPRIVREVRPWS
jgi:hypothetical protein